MHISLKNGKLKKTNSVLKLNTELDLSKFKTYISRLKVNIFFNHVRLTLCRLFIFETKIFFQQKLRVIFFKYSVKKLNAFKAYATCMYK